MSVCFTNGIVSHQLRGRGGMARDFLKKGLIDEPGKVLEEFEEIIFNNCDK